MFCSFADVSFSSSCSKNIDPQYINVFGNFLHLNGQPRNIDDSTTDCKSINNGTVGTYEYRTADFESLLLMRGEEQHLI